MRVSACPTLWGKKCTKPQVEQTKRPVCVSGWGIWMASGGPGRLVVTQVTPEVPGEKHIAAFCSRKGALKHDWRTHLHSTVSCNCMFFFYYTTHLSLKIGLLFRRWTTGKSGQNKPRQKIYISWMQCCWEKNQTCVTQISLSHSDSLTYWEIHLVATLRGCWI